MLDVEAQPLGTEFFVTASGQISTGATIRGVVGITLTATSSPLEQRDFYDPVDLAAVQAFDVVARHSEGQPGINSTYFVAMTDEGTVLSTQMLSTARHLDSMLLLEGERRTGTLAFVVPVDERITKVMYDADGGRLTMEAIWTVD